MILERILRHMIEHLVGDAHGAKPLRHADGGIEFADGGVRRLAEEGAQVIVNDIDAGRGEQVAASIRAAGGRAFLLFTTLRAVDRARERLAAASRRPAGRG
jgi:hypothetical protein